MLIYPVTDCRRGSASYSDNATGYFLTGERDGLVRQSLPRRWRRLARRSARLALLADGAALRASPRPS